MSPAIDRGLKKMARTVVQLAAGGALTALVTALAGGLSPTVAGLVLGAWTALVAGAQNSLESAGKIGVLLPTSGLVASATSSQTEATVSAAVTGTGEIEGTVTDLAGGVVGEVVGQVGYVDSSSDKGDEPA